MNAASPALRDLISMGRKNTERIPRSLKTESAWKNFNGGNDSWIALAAALRPDELEHLIRGLVLYGRASGRFHKGRLSPLSWLFRMFRFASPEHESALAAWVVANRTNPWDPFGVMEGDDSHTLEESTARERARLRASLDRPTANRAKRATVACRPTSNF